MIPTKASNAANSLSEIPRLHAMHVRFSLPVFMTRVKKVEAYWMMPSCLVDK